MSTELFEYLHNMNQGYTPSKYQQAIYNWIRTGAGHAIVNAVAGSGKTTTLVEAIRHCFESAPGRILFLAFNKHIAEVLKTRIPAGSGAIASTCNAFGWGICRTNVPGVKLDRFKDDTILRRIVDPDLDRGRYIRLKGPVLRMVSLLKSLNESTATWQSAAAMYGIELGDLKPMDRFADVLAEVYRRSVGNLQVMNFDDQVFQPIYRDWPIPSYRWVLIDESQDLSPVNVEMARRLSEHGRMILVGDPDQSIYLFRGAHPDAMGTLAADLGATSFPLSVCYRCASSIIECAKEEVPRIEAPEPCTKGEGVVESCSTAEFVKDAKAGDVVLCRTTAPLVKRCLQFIRDGRKAFVKGRDIGQSLVELIEKIHGNAKILEDDYFAMFSQNVNPSHEPDVPVFLQQTEEYYSEQLARMVSQGREAETIMLDDRISTIKALAEDCDYVVQLIARIEGIFDDGDEDEKSCVLFMTIHKAKGGEWERVWILRRDLCPHPKAKTDLAIQQEHNLMYVAKTRAMQELRFVEKEQDEK